MYLHHTGARVLSLVSPDDNKVFGINFRTPPSDHTGLPHILEHSVLCGSARFPVKEPFKNLLKTSLQTFLNAFTYPDRTCYPVASRNLKDFHNLMDVYLDAVFFPRLTPAVLGQEGWRVQWRPDGSLEYQGVVFNEMKGVYASADSRWEELAQRALHPDTPYRFDYGGDPAHIPDLGFETFLAFHRAHYHPANAYVYFYGDDDPAERLERLDAVLSQVAPGPVPPPLPLQSPWNETRRHSTGYPAGEQGDEGVFAGLGWLLDIPCTDLDNVLLGGMAGYLLYRNPASPLRLALLESGLGEDLIGHGVGGHLNQLSASFGLRGVEAGDEDKVFSLVLETLERVVREGFRKDLVEGAFNTTEFYYREQNTGGTPRGLVTMLQALNVWIQGGDPLEALSVQKRLDAMKRTWEAQPACFVDWIERHLLQNPARAELVAVPDRGLTEQEQAAEATRLSDTALRFARDPAAEKAARALADEVESFQRNPDPPEAVAKLPTLRLDDVSGFPSEPVLSEAGLLDGIPFWTTELDSSGILYLNLVFDIRDLPQAELPLLSLYGRCLTELGTEGLNHIAFNERVSCVTGGIHAQIETAEHHQNRETLGYFVLRVKCLADKIPQTVELVTEMIGRPRLGPASRVHQILLEEKANEEAGLIHNGSRVVGLRLSAAYSAAERATEEMSGLAYLRALRIWETEPGDALEERLQALHRWLLRRNAIRIHAGGDAACLDAARAALQGWAGTLAEGRAPGPSDWTPMDHVRREGLVMPSPVNFVGLATRLHVNGDLPHASVLVAARLLRNDYLWDQVRVRGGAYGASCSFDRLSGTLSFTSYRDPHLRQSLDVYRNAPAWLREWQPGDRELEQTIIGTLGVLSRPRHPESACYRSLHRHLTGLTENMRRIQWDEVRSTGLPHLQAFANQMEQAFAREERLSVLGSRPRLSELSLDLQEVMD